MKHTMTLKALIAAGLISTSGATSALADGGNIEILSINPGTLVVLSNGQDYTQLQGNAPVIIETKVLLDVDNVGSISSWWVQPYITTGVGIETEVGGMWFSRHSESYPFGSRPKIVNKTVDLSVAAGTLANHAVSMCNTIASGLRFNGASDAEIFGQDRHAHFNVFLDHDVDFNGAGSGNPVFESQGATELDVICKGFEPPVTPGTNGGFAPHLDVERTMLSLTELTSRTGACRVRTRLRVQTNLPNAQVNYRYLHSGGAKSETFGTVTDDDGNFTVVRTWNVPKGNGPETGWFQVEGVSTNFQTNQAAYEMECENSRGINRGGSDDPDRDINPQ